MNTGRTFEGLLRELAPQALAAVARRTGSFADAEDAVQEAIIKASQRWDVDGVPDRPLGWVIRVASRELIAHHRSDTARQRREQIAASWQRMPPDAAPDVDDSLTVLFMCCRHDLTPAVAIPLTLRAVGGLTTAEIAAAFLVKEATMAQRISRAKATIAASPEPFRLPDAADYPRRLALVLHVLYLIFNEGHTASRGDELARIDLSSEAIRLARKVHAARPDDPEVTGLLALLLLVDARRAARTGPRGEFVPLVDQDRSRWNHDHIREGVHLATTSLKATAHGPYQLQAAIAAIHDQAPTYADTNWTEIVTTYDALDRLAPDPVVTINRSVAVAMAHDPSAGLAILDTVDTLDSHHRYHAVRAHLLELSGEHDQAVAAYDQAITLAMNTRERAHLQARRANALEVIATSTDQTSQAT